MNMHVYATYIPLTFSQNTLKYMARHPHPSRVLRALIPMTTTTLLEASFVDLIAAIEQAGELSEQRRRHWACSLRQMARWLDRPASVIPARWNSVQNSVGQLHHARVGVTAKTLANHKSNVRAALRWFGKEHDVPQRGVPLSTAWATFRDRIDSRRLRQRLYSFMRYCSARKIGPESVDYRLLDEYWRYRTETTALTSSNTARRFLARSWNACAAEMNGWPLQRLTEPPIKTRAGLAWNDFPEGLRIDIENYLAGLTKLGTEPNVSIIDLGWKLLRIGRETGCLNHAALTRLDEIRAALEDYRRSGLTSKNLKLIRQVLTEGIWS